MIAFKEATPQWIIKYVGGPLLIMLAWDFAVVYGYRVLHWEWAGSSWVPLTLYGTAMSIIVGFRNNYAYARWWEARTLWGSIVNNSRSVARQATTLLSPRPEGGAPEQAEVVAMQREIVHYQIAWVHALRQQLRGLDPLPEIRDLVPESEHAELAKQKNVAVALQQRMSTMLKRARVRSWITDLEWQAIDKNLDNLIDAQGGAERIKSTPLPRQYHFFPRLFVQIYCLMLPIGMVERLGWYTPIGSTLVGFMFVAIDKIGTNLEDPFDNQVYDVPLTAICKTIEINLRQLLGDNSGPPPETPVRGVLW